MAHSTTSRRFYIDIDSTDDQAVVRSVPVHQAEWVAPESTAHITAATPATHSVIEPLRSTPHRVSDMLRAVRKRHYHSR